MKDTLTPNEWIVMNALWEKHPATLSEAIAAIGSHADWNYKTYQSYMLVLERKGLVTAEKRGRDKFYSPAVSKQSCVEQEKRSLLSKLEGDSVRMLIAGMVEDGDLGQEGYQELSDMLDALLKKEGRS